MKGEDMRKLRYITIISCSLFFILAAFSLGMAVTGIQSVNQVGSGTYNRFLASDLGFTAGGKNNKVFSITFGANAGETGDHHLYIKITSSTGKTLLSGTTKVSGNPYNTKFSGRTLWNYEILDELGGRFQVSSAASDVREKILKTGEVPQGVYGVYIELRNAIGTAVGAPSSQSLNITVIPAYLQTVYPVDTSVTKSGMNFKVISKNVQRMEAHLYSDSVGNKELTKPSEVIYLNGRQSFDASSWADPNLIKDGGTYYWQIHGYISTTHGDELVKSPLNAFLYFEDRGYVENLGLSDVESNQIMNELFEIVQETINRRAANSMRGFEIERVLIDGNVVTDSQEIMAILKLIKDKEVTVNSASFR
jgi:hypothetical protein